jgi:integrase/recombinase XerD
MSTPHGTHDWRAQFISYLADERAYSKPTISAYQSDLDQFTEKMGKDPLSASTDDIRKFILHLLESGISSRSARRKLAAIRSFLQFVFGEGGIQQDASRHIRAPHAFRAITRPITRGEVDQILSLLSTDRPLDLRNRALVYAVYGSGVRVSEIAHLNIADVDFAHAVAKVRRGKGQKDRLVPLNLSEIEAIRLYLERARPRFAVEPDNGVLFIGKHGDSLTRQRLWQVLIGLSMKAVGRKISPHKYRHAFVSDTINGGAGFRVVQKMVGHASVTTTMGYMHSDLERTRAEYLKSHPRGVAL